MSETNESEIQVTADTPADNHISKGNPVNTRYASGPLPTFPFGAPGWCIQGSRSTINNDPASTTIGAASA